MDTIRLGMIGAGFIAEIFAERIVELGGVELAAVCAFTQQEAEGFAQRFAISTATDDAGVIGADPTIDAVYVASPNSLHAAQAIAMLEAGKHVLVEKPMALNAAEVAAMIAAARRADRLLMEAYIAPFEPNVAAIRDAVAGIPQLRRAVLIKDQYSSRFDAYKAGSLPAAFNPAYGGGSIMDLGFYPVSLAVHLFGAPQTVLATGVMLDSGADGQGSILLGYDGFEVACMHSKIATPGIGSQIAGELSAVTFDEVTTPTHVELLTRGGDSAVARSSRRPDAAQDITRPRVGGHMDYEIEHYLGLLRADARESNLHPLANSLTAMRILDEARRQVGVHFPTDPTSPQPWPATDAAH